MAAGPPLEGEVVPSDPLPESGTVRLHGTFFFVDGEQGILYDIDLDRALENGTAEGAVYQRVRLLDQDCQPIESRPVGLSIAGGLTVVFANGQQYRYGFPELYRFRPANRGEDTCATFHGQIDGGLSGRAHSNLVGSGHVIWYLDEISLDRADGTSEPFLDNADGWTVKEPPAPGGTGSATPTVLGLDEMWVPDLDHQDVTHEEDWSLGDWELWDEESGSMEVVVLTAGPDALLPVPARRAFLGDRVDREPRNWEVPVPLPQDAASRPHDFAFAATLRELQPGQRSVRPSRERVELYIRDRDRVIVRPLERSYRSTWFSGDSQSSPDKASRSHLDIRWKMSDLEGIFSWKHPDPIYTDHPRPIRLPPNSTYPPPNASELNCNGCVSPEPPYPEGVHRPHSYELDVAVDFRRTQPRRSRLVCFRPELAANPVRWQLHPHPTVLFPTDFDTPMPIEVQPVARVNPWTISSATATALGDSGDRRPLQPLGELPHDPLVKEWFDPGIRSAGCWKVEPIDWAGPDERVSGAKSLGEYFHGRSYHAGRNVAILDDPTVRPRAAFAMSNAYLGRDPTTGANRLGNYYVSETGRSFTLPADANDPTDIEVVGRIRHPYRLADGCRDLDEDGSSDDDGDGLCDNWESLGIDVDDDATIDLDLPALGADPEHKDLFVEIDYMANHRPRWAALEQVVEAFSNAPVDNPDGDTGITLHLRVDRPGVDVPESDRIAHRSFSDFAGGAGTADFDDVKANNFGAQGEGNPQRDARRLAFRYALYGHSLSPAGPSVSGLAEIGGNDFIVTLGEWEGGDHGGGTVDQEAGTFMHEFGHTLGLKHGGDENLNCKPNYLSVMSYTRQVPGWYDPREWRLDYSRRELPVLNESDLDEQITLAPVAGLLTVYNTTNATGVPVRRQSAVNDPIDWDDDGSTNDRGVVMDISNVRGPNCAPFGGAGITTLSGFDDWANLDYNFRDDDDFADGVHRNLPQQPELSYEEVQRTNLPMLDVRANVTEVPVGRPSAVLVTVRVGGSDQLVENALINVTGAGVDVTDRTTDANGTARFVVHPDEVGGIAIEAVAAGAAPGQTAILADSEQATGSGGVQPRTDIALPGFGFGVAVVAVVVVGLWRRRRGS